MPDTWRYVERARPEHWYDMHVLHSILNPDDALGQCRGERGVYDQFGWRFILDGEVRCGLPRALCDGISSEQGTTCDCSNSELTHRNEMIHQSRAHREPPLVALLNGNRALT